MDQNEFSAKSTQEWLKRAARLPGKSLHIALAVIFSLAAKQESSANLSNKCAAEFGVDRNGKYRALAWLETAGLVEVKRKQGRPPEVRVLDEKGPT